MRQVLIDDVSLVKALEDKRDVFNYINKVNNIPYFIQDNLENVIHDAFFQSEEYSFDTPTCSSSSFSSLVNSRSNSPL